MTNVWPPTRDCLVDYVKTIDYAGGFDLDSPNISFLDFLKSCADQLVDAVDGLRLEISSTNMVIDYQALDDRLGWLLSVMVFHVWPNDADVVDNVSRDVIAGRIEYGSSAWYAVRSVSDHLYFGVNVYDHKYFALIESRTNKIINDLRAVRFVDEGDVCVVVAAAAAWRMLNEDLRGGE